MCTETISLFLNDLISSHSFQKTEASRSFVTITKLMKTRWGGVRYFGPQASSGVVYFPKGTKIEHLLNGELFENQHRPQLSFKSSDLLHTSPLRKAFLKNVHFHFKRLWVLICWEGSRSFPDWGSSVLEAELEPCSRGLCLSMACTGHLNNNSCKCTVA